MKPTAQTLALGMTGMGLILTSCAPAPTPSNTQADATPTPAAATATAPAPTISVPKAGEVIRVGGDAQSRVVFTAPETWTVEGDTPATSVRITTALPEGYPQPTPPGAIEIKTYPSVRRAQVTSGAEGQQMLPADTGMNAGFWPLFRHIQRRDIAMTSPVEMDYAGLSPDGQGQPERWTMSFLYRTSDLGPTGEDGNVEIIDTVPVTVVALGLRGPYGLPRVRGALATLDAWLEEHPEWEVAGEPRAFYYNGPEMPNARKWAEAQIPIRPRTTTAGAMK